MKPFARRSPAALGLLLLLLPFFPPDLAWRSAMAQPGEQPYLDVSIAVFDQNLPEDPQERERLEIHPQVRRAEARYMPVFLARLLIDSGQWGAVRVVPEEDAGADLRVAGRILRSDGTSLALEISASDSTGRVWLARRYEGQARPGVSLLGSALLEDPFRQVFAAIAADLEATLESLPRGGASRIKSVSFLRYGAELSPQSFSPYLEESPAGHYGFNRLPADDDPMRRRVEEIRRHEYLFIDVVDEQYQDFFTAIRPVYDLWREYRREEAESSAAFTERKADSGGDFRRGSYRALRESYDNFRWAKMQQQYLDEMATGFANETGDTRIELEDSLYQLEGSFGQQYQEWREILRQLFALERGPQ